MFPVFQSPAITMPGALSTEQAVLQSKAVLSCPASPETTFSVNWLTEYFCCGTLALWIGIPALHGIQSSPRAGQLLLTVRPSGSWLEMSVIDDGQGMPSAEVEQLFLGERPRVHALVRRERY